MLRLVFLSSPSEAGRDVAFLKLAGADAEAMAGVGLICKIRFLRPEKEAPGFWAQRTQVLEHQNPGADAFRTQKSGLRKSA